MSYFPRIGGTGLGLPNPQNLSVGTGIQTNVVTLAAGEIWLLPSGEYMVNPGPYTTLQFFDPVAQRWVSIGAAAGIQQRNIDSDGSNFRLANLTGCPVGAVITAAGNGASLTNGIGTAATGLTITVSAGGSKWVPVVGGAVNPTITITSGGSNYTYPPIVQFSPPPTGGIQASGYATISSATVNSIVTTNQGAGYTAAPTITLTNDPRDTTGSGAVCTVNKTLMGNTQVTALYPSDPGTALTAVPTFTFAPTSAITATAIMNFTVTGLSGVGAQTGYGTATLGNLGIAMLGSEITPNASRVTASIAGPIVDIGLTQPRPAYLAITSAANALTTTTAVIDGGFGFQAVPTMLVLPAGNGGTVATSALVTCSVGGITDTSYLQPL